MSDKKTKKRKSSLRADKTSREAFKITAKVSTSSQHILQEVRAGKDVEIS